MLKKILLLFLLTSTHIFSQTTVIGELRQYHKVTLQYTSAATYNETNGDALFRDIRLNVTITSPSNVVFVVPGYFAGDGDAANTSVTTGNKFNVNFTPTEIGTYTYTTSFRTANDIALESPVNNTTGTALTGNGNTGTFVIAATNKTGLDFRGKGVLEYVGEHFFRWSNGEYFMEFGADSPEVFLEFNDFDNTPNSQGRTYSAHVSDWETGNPQWKTNEGRGIIGVVNYLSNSGMNIHYFLTMNSFGDGQSAYPWTGNNTTNQFDVSKLAQWEIVFDHMMTKGVVPEFVLNETENQQLFEDNESIVGGFAETRKLYYREMVARFGYLNGAVWNIGEEMGWDQGSGLREAVTNQQMRDFADYLKDLLPRKTEPITIHNGPSNIDAIFTGLLNTNGYNNISFQGNYQTISFGHDGILYWVNQSASAGKKWAVRYTEPYVAAATDQVLWRKNSLWASLTAGGAGVQYYDGGGRDVTAQDYNTYAVPYLAMKRAKDFYINNNVPFWEMANNDASTSSGWMMSKPNSQHVLYLPNGGTSNVNLGASGDYVVKWYDPRNGGALVDGSVTTITANGNSQAIGNAPNNTSQDWVVLLANGGAQTGANISINNVSVVEGTNAVLTVSIDNPVAGGFTVDYTTQNNSATAGTDYTANSGTLTFSGTAGETQSISITTLDDATPESSEQFFVNLTNATNSVTITDNQGVVTLTDNDGTPGCTADYNEVGGKVIIEAENLTLNTGWSVGTTKTGFTGAGYITYSGSPSFTTPGNNPITATIQINTTGTYLFQWRNAIGVTGTTTDDNDTWVRFNDASEFFATAGANTIYPQGSGQTPVVNGNGGGNWFKVYSNSQAWNWQTSTNDNAPYVIYVRFDTPGVYTMEISSRSANHFIDRITLSNAGGNQDLALTETLCDSSPVAVTGLTVTPATGNITIGNTIPLTRTIAPTNATNQTGIWSSSNITIATVNASGLVTGVSAGSAVITYTTNDGSFTDTATITVSVPPSSISINNLTIVEGNNAIFTVSLDNPVTGGFTVDFATQDNSATAGTDYTANSGTLTFVGTAGETQSISITTLDDATPESSEQFFVNLTNATNSVTIADNQGVVTLTDNDAAASISINDISIVEGNNAILTVTLDNPVSSGFTVDFATQDNSATAGTDYTANNGTLTFSGTAGETQSISITTLDDATPESSEQFFVNLTNATNSVTIADNQGVVTLTDNDAAASISINDISIVEGNNAILTVTLDNPVSSGFTVDYTTQNNSATAGTDYTANSGTLTFVGTAGETQSISITTLDDAIIEANEQFFVNLSNASNSVNIADNQGIVTITDNDEENIPVSLEISDASAIEGNDLIFTITLDSEVSQDLVITFSFLNESASDLDYEIVPVQLVFEIGETTKELSIVTFIDNEIEMEETFLLQIASIDQGQIANPEVSAIGTIVDGNKQNVILYPVPLQSGNELTLEGLANGEYVMSVFTFSNKRILAEVIEVTNNRYSLTIPEITASGVYLLNLNPITFGEKIIKKFIIRK
jgi:hypothetical protein